jgi:hypothetical protein
LQAALRAAAAPEQAREAPVPAGRLASKAPRVQLGLRVSKDLPVRLEPWVPRVAPAPQASRALKVLRAPPVLEVQWGPWVQRVRLVLLVYRDPLALRDRLVPPASSDGSTRKEPAPPRRRTEAGTSLLRRRP